MTPMPRLWASSRKEGRTQPSPMEHHCTPSCWYCLAKEMGTPSTMMHVWSLLSVWG